MNRFSASNGELSFLDQGEGPAVLLLHGPEASSSLWRIVLPALSERMRVIVPDRSGGDGEQDLRRWADDMRELLRHLRIDELAVVGHGTGGVVAEILAMEGGVRCLVLIDAGPTDPTGAPADEDLQKLDIPALVLWGEEDPYLPVAEAERLADALPHATLVLLPGCGHLLPEEAPDTVATLVAEFLRARFLKLPHEHTHEPAPTAGPVRVQLGPTLRSRGPA